MRRSLGKFSHQAIGHTTGKKATLLSSSSSFDFSTTAGNNGGGGGGGGRGRGRGSDFPKVSLVDSVPGKREQTNPEDETSSPSPFGHGRGKPLQSSPNVPPSSSIGASGANTVSGRGRGTFQSPQFEDNSRQTEEKSNPRMRVFFPKDGLNLPQKSLSQDRPENQEKDNLPKSILSLLTGAGRGKPTQSIPHVEKVEEVNRHIKPRQSVQPRPASPKLSQAEAINRARGILFKKDDGGAGNGVSETRGGNRGMGARGGVGGGRGQRGGFSARGGGRGMGRGWGRGRGRGRGMSYGDDDGDDEDEEETADDKANAEKLARYLGPEKMDLLVQAYEEAGENVLPSPEEDAFVDGMHTNLLLECEPEYLMAEFDSNPDIDEKPPISLQDALEKMKPFLMAYEDIQTNKEWQDVVEETMKHLPLMKELVDEYSGPNRCRSTAKKQGEELERVAKTLPASTPPSIKRFTDRAVLSLQSNPGWGFHRKCQFMDKLVWEVSQSYK